MQMFSIIVLKKMECRGCGQFVCRPETRICQRCDAELLANIEAAIAEFEQESESVALAQEEEIRKGGEWFSEGLQLGGV